MISSISVIGYGHVGKAMYRLFPSAVIFDKFIPEHAGTWAEASAADLAVVCVPTPTSPDGSCDISIVEEVVASLENRLILIKSTVPPGTTDHLREKYGKNVLFSPEYFGESRFTLGRLADPAEWPFVIVGGPDAPCREITALFAKIMGPDKTYRISSAVNAELTKYMENTWLANQVIFANEFNDIATAVGANYSEVRELWALDPRVSKWHTLVFDDAPGFGGKCLPKDVAAIRAASQANGYDAPFIGAIITDNNRRRAAHDGDRSKF
jgi:UDPglucose 6-dehydrogenase